MDRWSTVTGFNIAKVVQVKKALEDFLPLKPDLFQILLALEDGDRHGYGLIKQVAEQTDGLIRLEPSPLYRRLRRLLEEGIVSEADHRPAPNADDERRRYYRLTGLGKAVLAAEAARLVELASSARIRALGATARSRA